MHYILYNTLSGNKKGLESARLLVGNLVPKNATLIDVFTIDNYADFWKNVDVENDTLILSGGDGTLNRFINANVGLTLPKNLTTVDKEYSFNGSSFEKIYVPCEFSDEFDPSEYAVSYVGGNVYLDDTGVEILELHDFGAWEDAGKGKIKREFRKQLYCIWKTQ